MSSQWLRPRTTACSIALEDQFGPIVSDQCASGFDFTWYFESAILTLPVNVFFLLAALPRIVYLRREPIKIKGGYAGVVKLIGYALLAILQATLIGLWALPSGVTTRATIGTAVVTLVTYIVLGILSQYEHWRTIKPSTINSGYLFLSSLLSLAEARTLYYVSAHHRAIPIIYSVNLGLRVVVCILESLPKNSILKRDYEDLPPETATGVLGRSLFTWINPLLFLGNRTDLTIASLPALEEELCARGAGPTGLEKRWRKGVNYQNRPHSLLWASLRYYAWPILLGVLPRALQIGLTFAQPFLVETMVTWVDLDDESYTMSQGYGLIGAFALTYIGIAVSTALAQHQAYRVVSMMRASMIDMMFGHIMVMRDSEIESSAPVTLMNADIERISSGLRYIHDVWACIVEIPIALWLLWQQLGIASIAPIVVVVVCMLLCVLISALAGPRQEVWLQAIEKRVDITAQVLGSMKGVRTAGLTDKIYNIVQNMRSDEVKLSERFRRLLILVVGVAYSNVSISPLASFLIYSLNARHSNGTETLTPARAFTSLTLFTLLSTPISNLVEAVTGIATAVGSIKRINLFLQSQPRDDDAQKPHLPTMAASTLSTLTSHYSEKPGWKEKEMEMTPIFPASVSSREALPPYELPSSPGGLACRADARSAGWEEGKPTVINEASFTIRRGTLNMIVGPVGCGKSTFVRMLLRETPVATGTLQIETSAIAYCAQVPWLTNRSMQENILGESLFDLDWYNTVVQACALEEDILDLPNRDMGSLGSGATKLSGGQKQRVALARAVYSRAELIILDDAFSGLDRTTEETIFRALLAPGGLLRRMETTIVMTSSSASNLSVADHIIALSKSGTILEQGSYKELLDRSESYIQSLSVSEGKKRVIGDEEQQQQHQQQQDTTAVVEQVTTKTKARPLSLATLNLEAPLPMDGRRTGDMSVYWYYMRVLGFWRSLVFVFLICCYVVGITFPSIWVEWWTSSNMKHPNSQLGYWLGVYGWIAVMAVSTLVLACWHLMSNLVARAARGLHAQLLKSVLDSPMSFFHTTDVGHTTNRFSQDLQLIDMELPLAVLNTILTFFTCVAQVVVVCVSTSYIAATVPACLLAFYFVQRFYLRTSRQIRYLDIEAKAPLITHFLETLSGLTTIRSFHWETEYRKQNAELINSSQKPFYLLFAIQRWLELVIALLVAGFAVVLVAVAVATRGRLSAGFIGVALLNIVTFTENLQGLIMQWTVLETSIGAVSRVRHFQRTVESEHLDCESFVPPAAWPEHGAIEINDLVASYKSSTSRALDHISLSIRPGTKVGICGRSGSGKSSLISSLFRLIELSNGTITIDGQDITTLRRNDLRAQLNCIPQEPFLLPSCSVRLNIDPGNSSIQDEILIDALKKVQVWDVVDALGGLDATITPDSFSPGQKQLLCFARAMVRSEGKILILDEATSSIDTQTDEIMQGLIRTEFASHTVIAIAHRLETIVDFDEVIVMEAGQVKEQGNPQKLLEEKGAFAELYWDSGRGSSRTPMQF
ncbi:P-loop containing nucleoside triphosphate hydrolase protein [Aspergillus fijiensis CBS 313.89]|uniref:P-loop containing nucleoside triphosphate hydrolase protein n=1 Tax=Aspergillus fijiensis CBS 313.89 TaxID=1448319 RepID=A0A8G1RGR6_9EURO|nr:P-loop containing nucleoside triphosphate hydrolase protein [Aspergillus fijiensis CBS 313.89]RAK71485.1 P-loop containing nucleoside triphosphate hydrolase protein [Aspergillus fijiensis CBS 313.89]